MNRRERCKIAIFTRDNRTDLVRRRKLGVGAKLLAGELKVSSKVILTNSDS